MEVIYINIAVLAGGVSAEREVSLRSGKNVALALLRKGCGVALIDPCRHIFLSEDVFLNSEYEIEAKFELLKNDLPHKNAAELDISVIYALKSFDKVFLALHGGSGEDGRIQSALELFGIAHNGSSPSACAVSMDKILTKKLFAEAGLPTPSFTVCKKGNKTVMPPGYPCVVKPSNGGSSVGVTFVFSPYELESAVRKALEYCDEVVLEKAVFGKELTVGVLEDSPLAVTEIRPISGFYDYENKYIQGNTIEITPAELSDEVTDRALSLAKRAHEVLGLKNFSRTDMILEQSSGLLYLLETNAQPGMTETSLLPQAAACSGIDFDSLCQKMLG